MSKVIELSDEQYAALAAAAAKSHETTEVFVARWVEALSDVRGPVYFDETQLLRALGADDEELSQLATLENEDPSTDADI